MKLSWFLQANFLVLSLGLVLYIMFQINRSGVSPTLLNILGIQPTTTKSYKQLTWCETRVQSIEKPKDFKIYQDEFKWFVSTPFPQEIDSITVEKWLGQNCSLKIEPVAKNTVNTENFQTALIVNFIKGGSKHLFKMEPNVYVWKGQIFRSPQLETALNQLKSLPKPRRKK